jgi:hypothetical protein
MCVSFNGPFIANLLRMSTDISSLDRLNLNVSFGYREKFQSLTALVPKQISCFQKRLQGHRTLFLSKTGADFISFSKTLPFGLPVLSFFD